MRSIFQKFRKDESGATLVEYGIALIVAILVGGTALTVLGNETAGNVEGAHNSSAFDNCDDGNIDSGCAGATPQ